MSETPDELEEPDTEDVEGLDELLLRIPEMDGRLAATEETVAALVAELTDHPAGGPWLWDALTPERQRELWVELDGFVSWLQNRILCHHMSKDNWISPCWYRHPDAVEQLTALMVAHKASYHPKAAQATHGLVDWFQRCLWPTMDTLKQRMTFKACLGKGEHEPQYMPGVQLVAASDDFAAFVDESVPAPVRPGKHAPHELADIADPETGELPTPPAPGEAGHA
ncbi:hypothetical protein [Arthrobacter sp.]|uniref:hypothetical protein n=1 Tax=Arthrobacter sp. TaxID=1667 RepID=UPI003A8E4354